jgi:hypothetical protein
MRNEPDEMKEKLIQYLLGELPEEEQNLLEEQYLSDDDSHERLLMAEDELIEEYARGEMEDSRRERFERYFLSSPRRQKKLRFARTVMLYTDEVRQPKRSATDKRLSASLWETLPALFQPQRFAWQISLGFMAALLVAVGIWSFIKIDRLQKQICEIQARQDSPPTPSDQNEKLERQITSERKRAQELTAQLERERDLREQLEKDLTNRSTAPAAILPFLFSLSPISVRSGDEASTFQIPTGAARVQIELVVEEGDYKRFEASVKLVDGNEIWKQSRLPIKSRSGTKFIELTLPAKILTEGDYLIKLQGLNNDGSLEDAEDYSFTIRKR